MFRPVGKPRVAEEIVQQLRGLILRGEYRVGDKLPPERRLAEELGVNRASLREAIKALEQMGLVKTRQGDGTRVLDFMQTAGVEILSHLIQPSGTPNVQLILDVLEFRRISAREIARMAAERARPEDLRPLEELADRAADPGVDPNELLKLDFDFYVALTGVARNAVLKLLINTMRPAVVNYAPFFAQFMPAPQQVRKHQRDLIKAVAAGDGENAYKITDQYLKKSIELLQQLAKTA